MGRNCKPSTSDKRFRFANAHGHLTREALIYSMKKEERPALLVELVRYPILSRPRVLSDGALNPVPFAALADEHGE
jgi:hypothetical protein